MSSLEDLSANLKLSGEQINLETRPLGGRHIRPSSRATLYSPTLSRPGSAVPALLLYNKNEYEIKSITKRPLSADSPPLKSSHSSLRKCKMAAKFDLSKEDKANLPSTELFQNLLSEKIASWSHGDAKSFKEDNFNDNNINNNEDNNEEKEEIKDIEEDCQSDRCFGTIVQQFAQYDIAPGLKGKPPPIPKKCNPDPIKPITPKNASDSSCQLKTKSKLDTLEDILNKCVDFSIKSNEFCLDFDNESNDSEENSTEITNNDQKPADNRPVKSGISTFSKDLTVEDFEDGEDETGNVEGTLQIPWLPRSSSTSSLDVLLSEKQTDTVLETIRKQRVEFNVEDDADKENSLSTEYEKFLEIERNMSKDNLGSNKSNTALASKASGRQAKPRRISVKPSVVKVQPKVCLQQETSIDKELMPKKSILTKSKQKSDPNEPERLENVDTWISKKPCQTNYLVFLSKIEELESTSQTKLTDIPEHDKAAETKEHSDPTSYQDIVSILEELEKEDKKSQQKMETIKEIVETELSTNAVCQVKTYTDNISMSHIQHCAATVNHARNSLPSSNFNEILSYLDSVDKSCMQSLNAAKKKYEIVNKMTDMNVSLDTIPRTEDLELRSTKDLSHIIIELSFRLKEKSSAIRILQNEISKLRDQLQNSSKRTELSIKEKLKHQKEEYEGIVKRNLKFIDQLMIDKRTLNERCEGLVLEMKAIEDRFVSNMKAAEHRHHVELQKMKDMHAAGEKIRRERWIEGKTQKIKEMTVKGLAPELESMASKHEHDLADLRSMHKKELEELELRNARKTQQQCEALREQLTAERERALAHERDVLRERYDKLVESEEKGYQEQRKRLQAEHARRIEECEIREAAAITERDRAIKQARDEFEDKTNALVRRHRSEIKVMQETLQLEKEAWKNNVRKQNAQQLMEKEAAIREQCIKERDRDIEAVIERLEKEANETKNQIEEATENRIRRLKEKFEKEVSDLEKSEENAKIKCNEMKNKLIENEDSLIAMKGNLKHLEVELSQSKEISEKLLKERSRLKEIVEEETYSQIDSLKKEVIDLKEDKERQMQQLYSRVKAAVAHKDEMLSELSRDHSALQEKCIFLENLLEQQRKEYLISTS